MWDPNTTFVGAPPDGLGDWRSVGKKVNEQNIKDFRQMSGCLKNGAEESKLSASASQST